MSPSAHVSETKLVHLTVCRGVLVGLHVAGGWRELAGWGEAGVGSCSEDG